MVKVVIVGAPSTGKTTLFELLQGKPFSQVEKGAVTAEAKITVPSRTSEHEIDIKLSDTEGGSDFDKTRPTSYRGTDTFLICVSMVDPESCKLAKTKFLKEVNESKLSPANVIFVATKTDLMANSKSITNILSLESASFFAKTPLFSFNLKEVSKKDIEDLLWTCVTTGQPLLWKAEEPEPEPDSNESEGLQLIELISDWDEEDSPQKLKDLLKNHPKALNCKTSDPYIYPIFDAIFYDRLDAVKIMVESGANLLVQTHNKMRPLQFAKSCSDPMGTFEQIQQFLRQHSVIKSIKVTAVAGSELAAKDSNGLSDPYVLVECEGQKAKTKRVDKTLYPVWNETVELKGNFKLGSPLKVQVYDHDLFVDDYMGETEISFEELPQTIDAWYKLKPSEKRKKEVVSGDIHLIINWN